MTEPLRPEDEQQLGRELDEWIEDVGDKEARGALDDLSRLADEAQHDFPIGEKARLLRDGVGPYHILGEIGKGGMGVVFLAEQQRPVRREVALKIIRPGMDSAGLIARFESERQALALMDHPGIARVLDAGETASGRPYFAMEYIQGATLLEYCDQHRLDVDARADLFIKLCRAVHHAHQKGIIHRDLKPSNVLVTEPDGEPSPKVIDFGLAKALGGSLTNKSIHTAVGATIGTLEAMSPEQLSGPSTDVDVRTDIYGLGLILYRLLVGLHPLDERTLRDSPVNEIHRMIREVEPGRPSSRLRNDKELAQAAGERRGMIPGHLVRAIRGDLDWITLKALEKERARRYASVSEFAADVERYRRGEAVLAGPPGAGYRIRKFVTRHRAWVAAATGVLVLLVSALLTITSLWLDAQSSRNEARAQTEAAENLHDGLLSVLLYGVRQQFDTQEITFTELVRRAAADLPRQLEGDPAIEASIRYTLGGVLHAGRANEEALEHYLIVLRLIEQTSSPRAPDRADVLTHMGRIYHELERYKDADQTLEEAGRLFAERGDSRDGDRLNAQLERVKVLRLWRKHDAALQLLAEVRVELEEREPRPVRDLILAIQEHAMLDAALGNDEAERRFRRAIDVVKKIPSLVRRHGLLRHDFGKFLITHSRIDDARDQLTRAYAILAAGLAEHHVMTQAVVTTLIELAEATGDAELEATWRARQQ